MSAIKPPPSARFAVVIGAGSLFEVVDSYYSSMKSALEVANDLREDQPDVDVMKVIHATSDEPARLTTEF